MFTDIDLSNVVDHRYLTFEQYLNLPIEEKKNNILFYLSNGDVYKGTNLVSQSILAVNSLPENPSPNKIYIYDMKLNYFSLDDNEWHTIKLMPANIDDWDNPESFVTVETIKTYLNDYIKKYKASLIFNSLEEALAYVKDEEKSMPGELLTVLFNGDYVPCSISPERKLKAYSSSPIGGGTFDGEIDVKSTATITMGIDINGLITSDINVSTREGNAIIAEKDGIYCPAGQGKPIRIVI